MYFLLYSTWCYLDFTNVEKVFKLHTSILHAHDEGFFKIANWILCALYKNNVNCTCIQTYLLLKSSFKQKCWVNVKWLCEMTSFWLVVTMAAGTATLWQCRSHPGYSVCSQRWVCHQASASSRTSWYHTALGDSCQAVASCNHVESKTSPHLWSYLETVQTQRVD